MSLVNFDAELPEELIDAGRRLAEQLGTTLEAMLVEHMKAVVEQDNVGRELYE